MGKSKKLAIAMEEKKSTKEKTEFLRKEALFIADATGKAIGTILKPGTAEESAIKGMIDLRNDLIQSGANANLMALINGVIAALQSAEPLYTVE